MPEFALPPDMPYTSLQGRSRTRVGWPGVRRVRTIICITHLDLPRRVGDRSGPRVVPTAGYGLSSRHVSPECTCAASAGTGHGIPRPRPGELHVRQKRTTDYDKRSPKTFKATQGMHTCGPQSDRGRYRFEQYHSTRETRRDAHTDDTTDDGQLHQLGCVHVNAGHDKKLLHKVMRN